MRSGRQDGLAPGKFASRMVKKRVPRQLLQRQPGFQQDWIADSCLDGLHISGIHVISPKQIRICHGCFPVLMFGISPDCSSRIVAGRHVGVAQACRKQAVRRCGHVSRTSGAWEISWCPGTVSPRARRTPPSIRTAERAGGVAAPSPAGCCMLCGSRRPPWQTRPCRNARKRPARAGFHCRQSSHVRPDRLGQGGSPPPAPAPRSGMRNRT